MSETLSDKTNHVCGGRTDGYGAFTCVFCQRYVSRGDASTRKDEAETTALYAESQVATSPANQTLIGKAENAAYKAYEKAVAAGKSQYTAMRQGFKAYEGARSEIPVIDKALANAAEILANFKTEGNKLEEWQACYAKLFTQMAEMVATKRESGDQPSIGLGLLLRTAFDEGFYCRTAAHGGMTIEEQCEDIWQHSQTKVNIPSLLPITKIEAEVPKREIVIPTETMCDAARWFILARDAGITTWGKLSVAGRTKIAYIEDKIKSDPEGHITKWDFAECVYRLMNTKIEGGMSK